MEFLQPYIKVKRLMEIRFRSVGHRPRREWALAKDDLGYYFSSARFYETGVDEFGFLTDLFTVFDGD
jgi:hypothetical protein